MERHKILFPGNNGGRGSCTQLAGSPEFEFWRVRNQNSPQPQLLSADQLFLNGVILPLDLLHLGKSDTKPPLDPNSATLQPSGPRRWLEIFRKDSAKLGNIKKEEKKSRSRNSAELNINIWPFSRSRSAGNNGTRRSRIGAGAQVGRKANSAPCSRSNSRGESKSSVKGPSSPGRVGVHVGRSSPVWQARRGGSWPKRSAAVGRRSKPASGNKAKVFNAQKSVGHENHLSCRSNNVGNGSNLFGLRILFAKKFF